MRGRSYWPWASIVFLVAVTLFGVRFIYGAREEARAMSCANNLKQIALGLHNYHDAYRKLPRHCLRDEKGTPIHSWRPKLIGYLAAEPNFYHWEEPWDSPKNRGFALNSPIWIENEKADSNEEQLVSREQIQHKGDWLRLKSGWYSPINHGWNHRCPCHDHQKRFVIDYVAVTGEQTAWPDSKAISFSDITDSPDTTILLVEINHSDILWSEPRDLRFDLMHFEINSKKGPSISSPHPAGPAVAFVDGSVARLSETIPPEAVKALLTIAGGEKLDKEEMKRKGWIR